MENLINGKLYSSVEKIEIKSPIDNRIVGYMPSMTKEDIDYAMSSARKALDNWKNLTAYERSKYLIKIAEELEKDKEMIARTMVYEIAKPYKDAIVEVERTIHFIKHTVHEMLCLNGEIVEGQNYDKTKKVSIVRYEPYGVVLCIAPFNYPINLTASKVITAIAAGNTVVYKSATQGSITSLMFIKAIYNAKLPEGVVNSVSGKGSRIGDYLNTHKEVDLINFTGSTKVGQSISEMTKMIPLIMELGGKDAAIVLKDCNIKKTAKEIIKGAFSYSGQRCTAIKRVLVEREIEKELLKELDEELLKLKVGSALDNADITEVIDSYTANYLEELIKDSMKFNTNQEFKRNDNLIHPMIFFDVDKNSRIAIEEPFGPVLPVIVVDSINEAIEIANSSEYGLQSSVFTKDVNKALYIASKLEVGTVQINNKTQRGPDNFPFLGIKNSGIGVQGIKNSIRGMQKIKTIILDIEGEI